MSVRRFKGEDRLALPVFCDGEVVFFQAAHHHVALAIENRDVEEYEPRGGAEGRGVLRRRR
jgi:hypothetical protein